MTEFDFFEQDVEADTAAENVVEPDSFDADITAATDFDPQDVLTATPDDTVELPSDATGEGSSPLGATVDAPDLDDTVVSPPDPIAAADSFDFTAFGQGAGDAPRLRHAVDFGRVGLPDPGHGRRSALGPLNARAVDVDAARRQPPADAVFVGVKVRQRHTKSRCS